MYTCDCIYLCMYVQYNNYQYRVGQKSDAGVNICSKHCTFCFIIAAVKTCLSLYNVM